MRSKILKEISFVPCPCKNDDGVQQSLIPTPRDCLSSLKLNPYVPIYKSRAICLIRKLKLCIKMTRERVDLRIFCSDMSLIEPSFKWVNFQPRSSLI